jgi:thiamine pyrophosphokinase
MNVIIFANGETVDKTIVQNALSLIKSDRIIIACDGGVKNCEKAGLKADYIVGDMDSIDKKKYDDNKKVFLPDQNLTDLKKAILFSRKFSPTKTIIFSAFGKRFDHTLTNLFIFNFEISDNTEFYDNFGKLTLLNPGNNHLNIPLNKTVSFFSLTEVKNLRLTGFEYEFHSNKTLPYFIGISNVVKSKDCSVYFENGKILCYEPFKL